MEFVGGQHLTWTKRCEKGLFLNFFLCLKSSLKFTKKKNVIFRGSFSYYHQTSIKTPTKIKTIVKQIENNSSIFEFEVTGSKPTTIFLKINKNSTVNGVYEDVNFDLPCHTQINQKIYTMTIIFGSKSTFNIQLNVTNSEMKEEHINVTVFTADYEVSQEKAGKFADYVSVILSNTFISRHSFVSKPIILD